MGDRGAFITWASERRAERIDKGLCIECGDLARPNRVTCFVCAKRVSKRDMIRYVLSNPKAKVGARKCSCCRKPGHDRRLCREVE